MNLENFGESWKGERCILKGWSWKLMLFKMTFLTTFISIIKLNNQIWQIFFLNLMNKLKIMIFNFMAKRKKSGHVPPTLHYCGHNAKKNRTKKIFVENLHATYTYTLHYLGVKNASALPYLIKTTLHKQAKYTYETIKYHLSHINARTSNEYR